MLKCEACLRPRLRAHEPTIERSGGRQMLHHKRTHALRSIVPNPTRRLNCGQLERRVG